MRLTDYKTEYLLVALIAFAIFSLSFGLANWGNNGMVVVLGILFPFLFSLSAVLTYFKEVVIYYDEKTDSIHIRKLLQKTYLESFGRMELKELKIKWHLGGQLLSFISPVSKKRYKGIANEKAVYLIKTWIK